MMKSKTISLRLTSELADQIQQQAIQQGVTKSEYILSSLEQSTAPVDKVSIAKTLCEISTVFNQLSTNFNCDQEIQKLREGITSIWRALSL